MKSIATLMFALLFMFVSSLTLTAQSAGDFRTQDSGNWNNPQIWQRYNGSSWVNTANPPSGSETITVQEPDSVFINVAVSITGTLINHGIVEGNSMITFADGGTYQHDRDAGKIPISTWETGSTLLITGVSTTAPDDRAQNYYNVTFNTPDLLSNLNMDVDDNTIGGDIRVINTGLARWYLTSVLAQDTAIVTIMGDVFVEDGAFSVQGTSNAQTTFIVHHYGNIEVTGGNFSIARGSQAGGTTTWYIYEGNFSMSNATTQNSNVTPDGAKFVFTKEGTQTLALGAGNTLTALPILVESGTTLDMGASALEGSGNFTVEAGATIMTTLPGGVADIVSGIVATVTLEDESGYGFNGAAAQITSTAMPATVGDLIIDNAAGVALSQPTTINGVLRLISGVFDNTIPFTLGPNGSISYEGGSLLHPVAIEPVSDLTVPESFFVDQNYPNPFNPSTTIRFGVPSASHVTVRVFNVLGQEVANLHNGRLQAGEYKVQFDAAHLSSGMYLYQIQAGEAVSTKRMMLLK